MEIFPAEQELGLGDLISKASTLYEIEFSPNPALEKFKSIATNLHQPDLYYLDAVLVSAGFNKNDDVFSIEEVWNARHTPVDKKFNVEHKENDIIGHITGSFVVNDNWEVIDDSTAVADLPDKIHIVTNNVLYKIWDDPDLQDRMDKIIAEIPESAWFVSMECLFRGFDYSILEPDGTETVISRDKSTAHLTQYLRAYGGSGKYQGKRIGRRLKNVTYSGVGLVRRPANPESVILTDEVSNASENLNMETYEMADELKSQLAEANETIKSLRQRLEELNEKQVKEKVEAFENKITALENSVASLTEKLDDANKTIKSLSEKVTATETAKVDVEKKLAEVEAKARTEARVSTLIAAGKDEKEARELADSFAKLDDEAFKSVAAVIEQSLKAIKEAAKPSSQPDPETDTAEANVDDLETAEAAKTNLNANDVDETDAEKALASDIEKFLSE